MLRIEYYLGLYANKALFLNRLKLEFNLIHKTIWTNIWTKRGENGKFSQKAENIILVLCELSTHSDIIYTDIHFTTRKQTEILCENWWALFLFLSFCPCSRWISLERCSCSEIYNSFYSSMLSKPTLNLKDLFKLLSECKSIS